MRETKAFHILETPLEGTNLIEASAGTGKTYAIAGLFLRLILEKNLSPNEILVVTFTEAATAELKDRIRGRLLKAIGLFSGEMAGDDFLNALLHRNKNPRQALAPLRDALRTFDLAAIFTIHGFCHRMLYEHAFESGIPFDTELMLSQENLIAQAVDDFWRVQLYEASPLFVNYVIYNKFTPDNLLSLLGNRVTQPFLRIIPNHHVSDTSKPEKEFNAAFSAVKDAWKDTRPEVEKILLTDEGLNRIKYRKKNIPKWFQYMDRYLETSGYNPLLFDAFEKFTETAIKASVKQGFAPPDHTFFRLCEGLKECQEILFSVFEKRLNGLKVSLFQYVKEQMSRRKQDINVQSFDDLLSNLQQALVKGRGKGLSKSIRKKFRAALIDEFQDTDALQYGIFNDIFGSKESTLFLIGDPKQAIYSFRSADIFAYMKAADNVSSRHTLLENWRSDSRLITAINTIFEKAENPFVYADIPFQSAVPSPNKKSQTLQINGRAEAPFHIWYMGADQQGKSGRPIPKGRAKELIPKSVAAEISRLLKLGKQNQALFNHKPLTEEDIAILVRTNAEARIMQSALSDLKIPSVLHSAGDLFESHEALEMERLLLGIVNPSDSRSIRLALSTDMMGITGEEIFGLMEKEDSWEEWLLRFGMYHDLWARRNFIQMFRRLLLQENVLPRLMSLPDGERRTTNVLHVSEVLHQVSVRERLGMEELLKWLSEQRRKTGLRPEEHPIRLETDKGAVKVLTIHKSKGLEFPIVFCPFSWGGSGIEDPKAPFIFHDQAFRMDLTLDLGSERREEHRKSAEQEILAENVRLLYVALTRAKSRCYLVWGRFKGAETSALAYLLHQPGQWNGRDIVKDTADNFGTLDDNEILKSLRDLVDRAKGAIQLSGIPLRQPEQYSLFQKRRNALKQRIFSGNIDRQWRVSSFSSLISEAPHAGEMADRDALGPAEPDTQQAYDGVGPSNDIWDMSNFPRGTKAGIFFHDLLEHLDFTVTDMSSIAKCIAQKLDEYGFDHVWLDPVGETIRKLFNAPLHPDHGDLRLSRISKSDRLNELEFYYSLKTVTPENLKTIFSENSNHGGMFSDFPQQIERLHFAPIKGFMKGFMDLVFHWRGLFFLVDWKSNFLGWHMEDYTGTSLLHIMKNEYYILQYHIYILALHQYLSMRLTDYDYQRHFGGVFYLFLRGIDPEMGPDYGIYRDLPSYKRIQALSHALLETGIPGEK